MYRVSPSLNRSGQPWSTLSLPVALKEIGGCLTLHPRNRGELVDHIFHIPSLKALLPLLNAKNQRHATAHNILKS